jgi:hypothetical protein
VAIPDHGPAARRRWPWLLLMLVTSSGLACFHGFDLEDKQPRPGYAGGVCLPDGCYDAVECLVEENICVDPFDPCRGVYCGGNGTCAIDMTNDNQPLCVCDPGTTNTQFAYFCQ